MNYCAFISSVSTAVYNFLTEVFSYRLSFSEVGMTDHLLLNLIKHSHSTGQSNVEIYKVNWKVESIYGNDIDLFIQNNNGTYNWYALQAKVMSFNGAFKDINIDTRGGTQQWDKLLNHETNFGSKTYYLLYSGKSKRPPTTLPTRSDCIGIPSIQELGLGIVETDIIKNVRTTILTSRGQFYFSDVYPNEIDSLRKLFCCAGNLPQTTRQFNRSEINTAGYQRIYFTDSDDFQSSDDQISEAPLTDGAAPVRIILSTE